MKYASERGVTLSVHQWKPIPADKFAAALHKLATQHCDEHGLEGVHPTAMKLDRETFATIWYRPKSGRAPDAVSSPMLAAVNYANGRHVYFERMADPETEELPIETVESRTMDGKVTVVKLQE